jgi:alginate O-acetyltransferase complex protein AlgI
MLFNSLQFVLFFIIITISFWYLPHKFRWFLLLAASCYFYMAFVPIYILILGSTIVIDYTVGIYLGKLSNKNSRKRLLVTSIVANIGILAVFKYYNFFNYNADLMLEHFNKHSVFPFLKVLLPIGLSFHTFQAMSYTIEVYRGNQAPERHFGIYALYVMFYPQLVAGPIERPQNMLWQFHKKHDYDFENLKSGLMQMAFGFFKKVVIADRLSVFVDRVYLHPKDESWLSMVIACTFYSFQIYCDFSGYSDIAIGAARTMGFNLMNNFNSPYLSKSVSEFWTRWHISLSTWFRDYLYIPLGGNRLGIQRQYLNLMIVFLLSGFWHGANWTFIIWGLVHGVFMIVAIAMRGRFKKNTDTGFLQTLRNAINVITTFGLVTLAWVFFRSPDISTAYKVFRKIFSFSSGGPVDHIMNSVEVLFSISLIALLLVKEKYLLTIPTRNTFLFSAVMGLIIICCYIFGVFNDKQFIYFQF